MALKAFFSPNDFSEVSLGGTKQFDVHHKADQIWLCAINFSHFYFDFLYPDGNFAGKVGKFERACFLLNPRPLYVQVQSFGSGTALAAPTPIYLLLGIDENELFRPSDIPVG